MAKQYRLFISHAWRYHESYDSLVDLLNKARSWPHFFDSVNYSSPKHDPALDPDTGSGKKALTKALDDQIRPVHCVLVLAGMYAQHSYWIQKEIDLAQSYDKPIVGIKPRGQQRIPTAVQEAALEMVGWNTQSILDAIRKHAI